MYVRVQVRPASKKESVIETDDRTYTISVKMPAERGLATARAKEMLADHLSVPLQKLRLISGHRSPRKIFTID